MPHPSHIFIVGPAWVGDMVMAQSLFIFIKQQYPSATIDVLAPVWSKPLLSAMPEVRKAIEMPLGHGKLGLGERFRLGKSLRKEGYDWSITLPNSWKSALTPFAANIPKRTGYKGEARYGLLNDIKNLDKKRLSMTVQRFVALAGGDQITLDDCPKPQLFIDQTEAKQIAEKYQLNTSKRLLMLCPGAEYGSAKCWPDKHYAELAQHFIKQDWQVVLLGSEKDQTTSTAIANRANSQHCYDLTGKTSLHEAILLLALANYVVSNDSGLMHIAAAVNSPVIAIYGSSDPKFTPPLSSQSQIATLNLDCSPCFKRECPLGHLNCLNKLEPTQIINMMSVS